MRSMDNNPYEAPQTESVKYVRIKFEWSFWLDALGFCFMLLLFAPLVFYIFLVENFFEGPGVIGSIFWGLFNVCWLGIVWSFVTFVMQVF